MQEDQRDGSGFKDAVTKTLDISTGPTQWEERINSWKMSSLLQMHSGAYMHTLGCLWTYKHTHTHTHNKIKSLNLFLNDRKMKSMSVFHNNFRSILHSFITYSSINNSKNYYKLEKCLGSKIELSLLPKWSGGAFPTNKQINKQNLTNTGI